MLIPDYLSALVEGDPVWHPRLGEGVVVEVPQDSHSDEFRVVFLDDPSPRVRSIRAVVAGLEPLGLDPARADVYEARERQDAEEADQADTTLKLLLPSASVFRRRYWRHEMPDGYFVAGERAPYLWLVEVFLDGGASVSGWGASAAAATEYVATRVAVYSVVRALTELGHYVLDPALTCPLRRRLSSEDACGILITFPDDSLVGRTIPLVLAVKTPFHVAKGVAATPDEDRLHADAHFRGFPANEYRLGRVLVEGPDAHEAVHEALHRLPDPIPLNEDENEDGLSDAAFDDLPF